MWSRRRHKRGGEFRVLDFSMLPALATARAGTAAFAASHSSSGFLPLYLRRLFHSPQMDLEFALYQMLWLCKSPKAVYVIFRPTHLHGTGAYTPLVAHPAA